MGQADFLPRGIPQGALAATIVPPDAAPRQYLVFSLGGEAFGISIRSVKEIIEFGQLTQVPMMPSLVRGVINLRGAVVPVVDLAVRFGRGETPVSRRTCIVIVEAVTEDSAVQVLGIIVDAVSEVMEISGEDVEPPPAFGAHLRSDFVAGMAKVNGAFVILIELSQVLSFDELKNLVGANLAATPETTAAVGVVG